MENILLSICIPTYNRSFYLDKCLNSIVSQIHEIDTVEIVVSNNASTDDTEEVVKKYMKICNKINYKCNTENIGGDKNIMQSMDLGNGLYLKLCNDYLELKEGSVLAMLNLVNNHKTNKEILFFSNGNCPIKNMESGYCNNLDEFLSVASCHTAGIGSIGLWSEHYNKIKQYYKYITKYFYQTEYLFESFKFSSKSYISQDKFIKVNDVKNKNIDYDYFNVFLNEYFNILITYLRDTKRISEKAYLLEKKNLFNHLVYPIYKRVRFKKTVSGGTNTATIEKIIFKVYKNSLFFYGHLLYMPFYLMVFYIKNYLKAKRNNSVNCM